MNKIVSTFVLSLIAVCIGVSMLMPTHAKDANADPVLPTMGMMLSGKNVTVVNPIPVTVASYGVALGTVTLSYGEKCYMFKGAPFVAVGVDGKRVLVRSRVQGPHYLYDEGAPVCSGDVLFWVDYQQYLLSAQAYQEANRDKIAQQSSDDRDRRIIRRLLDEELAAKPAK
jgi:hypothetical protein